MGNDAYIPPKNAPTVHGLTGSNDRTTPNAASDPICRKCATQEHGDHVPDECTCGDYPPTGGFPIEDFSHLAGLLRNANESDLRALLSNNLNTIIAALDLAGSDVKQKAESAAAERLRAMLDGSFHYKAYRGTPPDGVPTMRGDLDVVLGALPASQPEQPPLAAVGEGVVTRTDILREWFGGERYARDYEYLDANYGFYAGRVEAYLAKRTNPPPSPDVAALQSELGRWKYAALSEADEYERTLKRAISAEAAYSALLDANEAEDRRAEAAEALVAQMREALEPFAAIADQIGAQHPGWDHDDFPVRLGDMALTLKPFREARAILSRLKTEKPS